MMILLPLVIGAWAQRFVASSETRRHQVPCGDTSWSSRPSHSLADPPKNSLALVGPTRSGCVSLAAGGIFFLWALCWSTFRKRETKKEIATIFSFEALRENVEKTEKTLFGGKLLKSAPLQSEVAFPRVLCRNLGCLLSVTAFDLQSCISLFIHLFNLTNMSLASLLECRHSDCEIVFPAWPSVKAPTLGLLYFVSLRSFPLFFWLLLFLLTLFSIVMKTKVPTSKDFFQFSPTEPSSVRCFPLPPWSYLCSVHWLSGYIVAQGRFNGSKQYFKLSLVSSYFIFLTLSCYRRWRLPAVSCLQNIFASHFHNDFGLDDQLNQEAVWVAAAVAVMAAVIQQLIGVFSIWNAIISSHPPRPQRSLSWPNCG